MNFNSEEWRAQVKMIEEHMRELDVTNRNPRLDAVQTAQLRGQFEGLQWILGWPDRAAANVVEQGVLE